MYTIMSFFVNPANMNVVSLNIKLMTVLLEEREALMILG